MPCCAQRAGGACRGCHSRPSGEIATAAAAGLRTRDEGRGLALMLGDDSVAPWRMAGKTLAGGTRGKDGMGSDRAARAPLRELARPRVRCGC